jgi:protein TonB
VKAPIAAAFCALALVLTAVSACSARRERRAAELSLNAAAAAEHLEILAEAELKARGIEPPVIVRGVPPIYPEKARRLELEGEVVMAVKILEDGRAVGARILRSTSPLFDDPAVACVRKWRFQPATKDGQAVAVWYEATVRFNFE